MLGACLRLCCEFMRCARLTFRFRTSDERYMQIIQTVLFRHVFRREASSPSTEWTVERINTTAKSGCSSKFVMDPADNTGLRPRWWKVRWVISLAGVLLAERLGIPWVGLLTVASKRDGTSEPGNVTTSDELTPSPYVESKSVYISDETSLFFYPHSFTIHSLQSTSIPS